LPSTASDAESIHIALLRGINVGGRGLLAMADLRELFNALGFPGATTLLQSGNVVFRSARAPDAALEQLLQQETLKRCGVAADYFVRTAKEWAQLIKDNPFPAEAETDPGHLVVTFLKDAPKSSEVKALQSAVKGPEVIRAKGRHLYITYPAGIGRSKLTNTLIERKLGTRATARNWNTIEKLAALATTAG
jgi:uncharacterized protein (DUF1697 family)